MAKATTTIRQSLTYQSQHAEYFTANQALFNRVVAFYFDCIQAQEGVLDLNLGEHLAVCTVQTVEGTILATHFIGGGREIAG